MAAPVGQKSAWQVLNETKMVANATFSGALIGAVAAGALRAYVANNCMDEAQTYLEYYAVPLRGPGDDIIRFITGFPGGCLGFGICFAKFALPGAIAGGYAGYRLGQRLLKPW